MRKIMKRLLATLLTLCILCAMVPTAFAADATYEVSYELDKTSYEVGDTITATLVLNQQGVTGGFDLYSFTVDVGFEPTYLSYEGGTAAISQFTIDSAASNYNQYYDKFRVTWHGLSQSIRCDDDHTVIATLKFKVLREIAETELVSFHPLIGVQAGYAKEPDKADKCTITIGNPAAPTYAVSFDANGGTGMAPVVEDKAEGNPFILPQNPYTYDNHTFTGWKCDADGKIYKAGEDTYTMPAKAVKFTAQWKQDKYNVKFNGGSGTTGEAPAATMWAPGQTVAMLSENTLKKDGYTFVGWSYNSTTYKPGETFTMPENDVTFTAVWQENAKPNPNPGGSGSGSGGVTSYPVTVNSPANGTVAADKKSAASGATVTITVTPETGYKVGTVTVKDKNGKTIAATEKDGKYSFQMPASAVSVDVTFVKDGQSSVGDCPKDSTCPVDPFKDTANNAWWHDGIHYCVQQGLMNGVASDQFAPNGTTTRAMIVTILWRMEGSPATSYGMSFTDVPAGQWYTEAIRWAQSTGVVTGYDAKTFGPNDNVTREQLAAILYRYTAHKGGDVSKRSTLAQFTDVNQISSWALENIQWANAVGMVNGRTDTTIVPKGNATRAEAASMIQRFCQNVLKL